MNRILWDASGMEDYEALAKKVRADRVRIHRTVEKARAAGDLSRGAWDNVESGGPAKPNTYRGIEKALGWSDQRCERILAGKDDEGRSLEEIIADAESWPELGGTRDRILEMLRADRDADHEQARRPS